MTNVLRVILSGVAAKDPGQTPCVILSEATLVAKSKDLGGPALPRRHALFYGPVPGLCPVPHLVKPSKANAVTTVLARVGMAEPQRVSPKPSLAPLAVIPAHHHVIPAQAGISSLALRVSSPRGHDRCRITQGRIA